MQNEKKLDRILQKFEMSDVASRPNMSKRDEKETDSLSEVDKKMRELDGISTDEDIRYIIDNQISLRKYAFVDVINLAFAMTAVFVAFLALESIKGVNVIEIAFTGIVIIVFILAFIFSSGRFRSDSNLMLNKYVELRRNMKNKQEDIFKEILHELKLIRTELRHEE
jgi:hypothetical protein